MRKHRTAQGKIIDMTALATKYEKTRAVGNMKVNARGDSIDSNNKITVPVTQKVGKSYSSTVGNKSAQVKNNPAPPQPAMDKTADELELEELSRDDAEVEAIKAKENNQ